MEIITEWGLVFIGMAVIFGLYMSWGIGANDVANAMGMPVGSGAVTVKQAIIIAAIFEFAGAFIAGGTVTDTIRKGIIDPSSIAGSPELLIFGMLAALLAAGIWLMFASSRGWPVSTTHTIVGALIGFALAGIGFDAVNWGKIGTILASWAISPLIGGVIALLLMLSIRKLILNTDNPFHKAKTWGPVYIFLVGWLVSLITLFRGIEHLGLEFSAVESVVVATIFGLIVAFIGKLLINRVEIDDDADMDYHYASVEKAFTPMMVFTACAMAFAHGSNDVANGIGPMAAVLSVVQSGGDIAQTAGLPVWVLALGGGGIILGLVTMGYRVMQTIGTRITELTPTRGYCATLAAATTVALASKTGFPVSTTQVAVGAIMGVGLARGIGAIDLRVIANIVISWIITLPAGGILAAAFFFLFRAIFS
ncbi:MAG: inorganic phosphate transporter [Sedimenticola sp.]